MAAAFEEFGLMPGHMPLSRHRKCMTTGTCKYCPLGARFSADQVLDQLASNPRFAGLRVKCNAPAIRLITSSRRRVQGVEYLDNNTGATIEARASIIVVAAGTFETPKLLQRSRGAHWDNGVGNDCGNVGRFLLSHSQLKARGRKRGNPQRWFQEYDFPTLMSRSWDVPQHQAEGKLFLYNHKKLPNFDFAAMMIAGKSRDEIEAAFTESHEVQLEAFFEDKGQPANFVACDPSRRTRFGLPMTTVRYDRTPEAGAAIGRWLTRMTRLVEAMGYEVVSSTVGPPAGHHASGTCRMGDDPRESVTDRHLRVHGIDNLYLCSNAVFPTSSAVNPTLTLVALAFRLAGHLFGARHG
jgi:choline dehydrogenase-like flavoprotein